MWGLVARFKNGECIDECEVQSAISKWYLDGACYAIVISAVLTGLVPMWNFISGAMGTHALATVPECYRLPLSHGVFVRFLRFRLGSHHLRVNTGRWVQPPLPCCLRVCLRCHSACLDDEAHCLLVCSHPTILESQEKSMQPLQQHLGTTL